MLHTETKQRLREIFDGQTCRACGHAAQRLWRQQFYCQDCFPGARTAEVRVHRLFEPGTTGAAGR